MKKKLINDLEFTDYFSCEYDVCGRNLEIISYLEECLKQSIKFHINDYYFINRKEEEMNYKHHQN